jgi:hypothetical protein
MAESRRYASIGVFKLDPAQNEVQRAVLEKRIAPMVRQMRGFVTGFWCDESAAGRSHHYMVFEDEAGVRALHEQIQRDAEEAARHGVVLESLTILPVITAVSGQVSGAGA